MTTSRGHVALLQIKGGSKPGQTPLAIKIQVKMQDSALSSVSASLPQRGCVSELHSCWARLVPFLEAELEKGNMAYGRG